MEHGTERASKLEAAAVVLRSAKFRPSVRAGIAPKGENGDSAAATHGVLQLLTGSSTRGLGLQRSS